MDERQRYGVGKVKAAFQRDWDENYSVTWAASSPETQQRPPILYLQTVANRQSALIAARGVPVYEKIRNRLPLRLRRVRTTAKLHPTRNPALEDELRRDWTAFGRLSQ